MGTPSPTLFQTVCGILKVAHKCCETVITFADAITKVALFQLVRTVSVGPAGDLNLRPSVRYFVAAIK